MNITAGGSREDMLSYRELRRNIGIIGLALPVVLVVGGWIFGDGFLQPSISDYFYTSMRGVLVGSLCVIGVFLYSYRGYKDSLADNRAGNFACLCAVGAALCPTTPVEVTDSCQTILGWAHIVCAILFFGTLAYFCLFLFTKTHPRVTVTPKKRRRNKAYRVCGVVIVACIVVIVVYGSLQRAGKVDLEWLRPVFVFETAAVWAFGFSWFVKGGAFMKDRSPTDSVA